MGTEVPLPLSEELATAPISSQHYYGLRENQYLMAF
jgi:hypothetical protein